MRKIKPTTKLLTVAMAASLAIVTVWVLNNRVSARAMPACTRACRAIFSFGSVGITAIQTARFNVVNTRKCVPSRPCTPVQVEFRFVNSAGNVVTNVDGYPIGSSTATLADGQSAFLDLNGSSLVGAGRAQIRAEVTSCVGCGTGKGTVLATLEVFDNATGKTSFVMPDYPAISSHDNGEDE